MYECYKLLQSEHYRNCKFNANRFTTLHTWFPFRHRVDHTESFFIQIRVYTAYYFCIYDTTVFVNNELYNNTTLSTIFLCDSRLFDIFSQILHQCCLSTREVRHVFYNFEDSLFFRLFLNYLYRYVFYFHFRCVILIKDGS